MRDIRVGFVGAGQFANLFHYPSLARLEGVRVVAVADLDEGLRQKAAERWGIGATYTDHRAMLDAEELDTVYVIMRPGPLMPIALDVLAAGKAVFTEKPCGTGTAQTRRMAEAAAAADGGRGVVTMVGCNRRYAAVLQEAQRRVVERGEISGALAEFHKPMQGDMFGMSVLHADAMHVIDPLRAWLGDPVAVRSVGSSPYPGGDWRVSSQVYAAMLTFAGGATALFTANRRSGTRIERYELHGNGITCIVEPPERLTVWVEGDKEPTVVTGAELAGADDMLATYGYLEENRVFIDTVRARLDGDDAADTPTSFADNAKTMALCDRIEAEGAAP